MQQQVQAAKWAHRLWSSNDRWESVAAVILVVVVIGVPLYQAYRSR